MTANNSNPVFLKRLGLNSKDLDEMARLQDEQADAVRAARDMTNDPIAAIVPAQDRAKLTEDDLAGEEWEYMQLQEEQEQTFYAGLNYKHYPDDHEYGDR